MTVILLSVLLVTAVCCSAVISLVVSDRVAIVYPARAAIDIEQTVLVGRHLRN